MMETIERYLGDTVMGLDNSSFAGPRPRYAILGPNASLLMESDEFSKVSEWLLERLEKAQMVTIVRFW